METREHQKESKPMVTEVASIPVKAGQEEAFIRVFKTAIVPVYAAPGCHPGRLYRSQEAPSTITHILQWDDLAAQERFITSKAGRRFLTTIGPFLDGAARLEHLDEV
ncbi:MAG TPA: antibiotic biosynthesis monooxygenase family protein [Chloroflexota bacterium]|nr:antibiotic biosynthesis monooxygenase family protein [Chloroflexota bacterium]